MSLPSVINTATLKHIENQFDQWHKTEHALERYSFLKKAAWEALHSKHQHFAIGSGLACRYPADVAPFAAIEAPTEEALHALKELLAPGETVWVGHPLLPTIPGLTWKQTIECSIMVFPPEMDLPAVKHPVSELTSANAQEMVDLTSVAFPGFFKKRTSEMGRYFGIRVEGQLISMGGQRMALEGFTEVSGICTHPDHLGKQYASSIVAHLLHLHRQQDVVSFLHVDNENPRAQAIYSRLGFIRICPLVAQQLARE